MLKNALVAVFVLVSLATPALAGDLAHDLDGTWRRDDKKLYVIVGDQGMESAPAGEYASRFTVALDATGRVEWHHFFTRTADEGGSFETTTRSVARHEPGANKIELEFEWVDLDDAGKVTARGKETHTIERAEPLAEKDQARLAAVLAHHKKIDAELGANGKRDRALAAAKEALADPLVGEDAVLLGRKKALEKAAPAAAPKGARLDLTGLGLAVTIVAPEGGKATESFGAYKIVVNEDEERFAFEIAPHAADLAKRKAQIAANTINTLKGYVTDSADLLVYESEAMPGQSEFHFVTNVKVGELTVSVEDTKGPVHSKADVMTMLAAVKTLKPAR